MKALYVPLYCTATLSPCKGCPISLHDDDDDGDDGPVPNFPICQGTLPWQPNNFAAMKAN